MAFESVRYLLFVGSRLLSTHENAQPLALANSSRVQTEASLLHTTLTKRKVERPSC